MIVLIFGMRWIYKESHVATASYVRELLLYLAIDGVQGLSLRLCVLEFPFGVFL